MTIQVIHSAKLAQPAPMLLIHGGAGTRSTPLAPTAVPEYRAGLQVALAAGSAKLQQGATALEAVCAAVMALEDNPLFNSAHGAALTADGTAELDAAVMSGDGRAGAIAVSKHIRNPVLGACAVRDQTDHVLLVGPSETLAKQWGLETVPPEYFVTPLRQEQLREILAARAAAPRHGTVGAVALDANGHVACATSTGGIAGQSIGRVGDTAHIGAGSFASDDTVAVSCTGAGEAYIEGCVAHDIAARIRYLGHGLDEAVRATYEAELERRGATGGTIAVTPRGEAVIIHNSDGIFAGHWTASDSGTFV
jgi:beta-aspartyl-peptidase (threonine type)